IYIYIGEMRNLIILFWDGDRHEFSTITITQIIVSGLTQYSGDPRTEWNLGTFSNKEQLLEGVRNFRYKGGNTFTGQALLHVMEKNLRAEAGARTDTPIFLVLLTDGKSQDDAITSVRSVLLLSRGSGVKNADEAELRQMASEPVDLNVYNVNDFPLLKKHACLRVCPGFDMMEAFGLTQTAHSTVEGVAAEPFVFSALPTYTLYKDVQLTQSTKFIHPAGFSPEHTISIAFRLLQDSPKEPFALWQLKNISILCFASASTKLLQYFSLDYRGEVQQLTFDQPQVHRLFYGSFHKVSVSLSVDCQHVGERPARPMGSLPTDGFEMLGKLVKTRGPNSGSASFQLQSFEIVCNTTWASEDTCCDLPAVRDEESCPPQAHTCTCSSDIPGAPGDPGPIGKPGPRGEKGEKGELGQKIIILKCLCGSSQGEVGPPGKSGSEGGLGPVGSVGPRGITVQGKMVGDGRSRPTGSPGFICRPPGPKGEEGIPGPKVSSFT
uniref:VWFA domain-containing protein n=1 Tax=Oryzias melastigma TaxID=30732 RepID=A0A3B3BZQ4_ORYME